ncbi:MAG: reverse transcriptase family protein [Candidatus Cloacimonetes bacterium]|nr:reverse transcriptase family protein [Candidatus Cloacimonadota bacterium]
MKDDQYSQWKKYYESRGILPEIQDKLLNYAKIHIDNNTPVIFNFEHLTLLLGREKNYLSSVVNSPDSHYRKFKIKKRSGGEREITAPYLSLLEMQYWIYRNILINVKIHYAAHGFAQDKSIITNSRNHLGQKHLLKMDLKDFFPSIKLNRIIYIFKSLGYPNIIAFYLASICSYKGHLPQGSPTSPILSNIVSITLDNRLVKFARKMKLRYSRYADDLTFSGDKIPTNYIKYITDIINDEGFEVNDTKTKLYLKAGKRIVTGISVIGNDPKLPREYKRKLKQELHYIFTYGIGSHMAKKKIKKINYLYRIIGKVNFWLNIEPDNEYARNAKAKLLLLIDN